MDDAELDRAAKKIVFDRRLPYGKALKLAAAELANPNGPHFSEPGHARSDKELARDAELLSIERGVSFSEALNWLVKGRTMPTFDFSEPARDMSDAHLDARAQEYAFRHRVSYMEALSNVAAFLDSQVPSFREGVAAMVCFSDSGYDASAASLMQGQWIEIFRTGLHTSDSGESILFNADDLDGIATNYRRSIREAPLVEGHPEHDQPSYGWVDELSATPDGKLMMRADQVDPMFAERVRTGRFKKRSASFYPPRHPNNPTPGRWYLRHVGFLGAMQPAVAGMRDIDFRPAH